LAFLIFFTSVGFSIDMHFCGTDLKSISFTGKAKNCFELAASSTCVKHKKIAPMEGACEKSKKDCCHNKTLHFQADLTPDIPASTFLITNQLQDFIVTFVAIFINKKSWEYSLPTFVHYKPPLITKDIPILVQSFLL